MFDPNFDPYTTTGIAVKSLRIDLPWKLRAGVRYADRLAPRASGAGADETDYAVGDVIHDSLQDERFDIELDVEYQMNSRFKEQVIEYGRGGASTFARRAPTRSASRRIQCRRCRAT